MTKAVCFPDGDLQWLHSVVISWYEAHHRVLPTRNRDVTAWGRLVAEVMSQQTPMSRVQPLWQRWMQLWPTPCEMAKASPADVLLEWGRLGYPSRALRLRECAIAICARPDGDVPQSFDELLALPGVGPYTASALASFQFHQRVCVLDTNVRRVLLRVCRGIESPASSGICADERELSQHLLPADGARCALWNEAVMELGSLVCTKRNPACDTCPLAPSCQWLLSGKPAVEKRPRPQAWKGSDRQARGRVLSAIRAKHSLNAGQSPSGEATALTLSEALAAATLPGAEAPQAQRVIDALIADGLVVADNDGNIDFPR